MRKFYEDTMKRYMEEIQGRPPAKDGQALDLRSSSADVDHGSHRSENDNDSEENWDKTMSGGEDSSMDHQRIGGSSDMDHETNGEGGGGGGPLGLNTSSNQDTSNGGKQESGNKRFRTHMSNVQVKMMKNIFENYKTPTMPECLGLGNDIGLQKRVVQVWFQNARAKEKKARLYLQQVTGQEPEMFTPPRECRWCGLQFPENFAIQEHIFQKSHLEKVKVAIEQGLYDPESPGIALTQQAEALQNGGMLPQGHHTPPRQQDSATDSSPSPQKPNLGPGLSMMAQMAAGHGPDLPDSRSMLMPPFYGMNSYPIGVNTVHNV
jgi:AT-binding transcription factor 1